MQPANRQIFLGSIGDEPCKADAMAGLAAGLAHLSEPQRECLVTAAIGLGNDRANIHAIVELAAGADAIGAA